MVNTIGKGKCKAKKGYPTEEFAQKVVDLALINRRVMLRRYLCQYCEKWHVTSKTEREYVTKKMKYIRKNELKEKYI